MTHSDLSLVVLLVAALALIAWLDHVRVGE